jgi:hypothetical protein
MVANIAFYVIKTGYGCIATGLKEKQKWILLNERIWGMRNTSNFHFYRIMQ